MYLRSVVEEARYTEDFDNLRQHYPEMDEIQARLTWLLSRNPRAGEALAFAPDFYLISTGAVGNTPAFWIL
jgi:hypothetical protein